MKINWTVRIKNKTFWLSIIPAMLLLIQAVGAVFGFTFNFDKLGNDLINVVNAIFTVLAICGVVIDHTTAGVNDSANALTYTEPKKAE